MHAPPYFQMTISRFGVWRLFSVGLVAASTLSTGVWLAGLESPGWVAVWPILMLGVCISAIAAGLWRLKPVRIHWDTQAWHMGFDGSSDDPVRGLLDVAIDCGSWMLLRFIPDDNRAFRGTVWLPAQRRGHESTWHALRSTLYGARPSPDLLSATLL